MPHCNKVELGSGWVEVASVIRRPARHWKRWLSAAHSGILHTTPTPAAVEAWNLTHYTYTCRGPKAAHRAVEFYTEALPTPLCSCFSPRCLEEKQTNKKRRSAVMLQGFMTHKLLLLAFVMIFQQMICVCFCMLTAMSSVKKCLFALFFFDTTLLSICYIKNRSHDVTSLASVLQASVIVFVCGLSWDTHAHTQNMAEVRTKRRRRGKAACKASH